MRANWRVRDRLRQAVLRRDGWACTECGSRLELECHHDPPLSQGGRDHPDACRTVCRTCHIKLHRRRRRRSTGHALALERLAREPL